MTTDELIIEIKKAKRMGKSDRLTTLRDLAEELANDFTYGMSILEPAIEEALENTGEKIKEELGYYDVADVTQDISVTSSTDF